MAFALGFILLPHNYLSPANISDNQFKHSYFLLCIFSKCIPSKSLVIIQALPLEFEDRKAFTEYAGII
jgi:hypothetical protein